MKRSTAFISAVYLLTLAGVCFLWTKIGRVENSFASMQSQSRTDLTKALQVSLVDGSSLRQVSTDDPKIISPNDPQLAGYLDSPRPFLTPEPIQLERNSSECVAFWLQLRGTGLNSENVSKVFQTRAFEKCERVPARFEKWHDRFRQWRDGKSSKQACVALLYLLRSEITDWATLDTATYEITDPKIAFDKMISRNRTDILASAHFAARLAELDPEFSFAHRVAFLGYFGSATREKFRNEDNYEELLEKAEYHLVKLETWKNLLPEYQSEIKAMRYLFDNPNSSAAAMTKASKTLAYGRSEAFSFELLPLLSEGK